MFSKRLLAKRDLKNAQMNDYLTEDNKVYKNRLKIIYLFSLRSISSICSKNSQKPLKRSTTCEKKRRLRYFSFFYFDILKNSILTLKYFNDRLGSQE